MFMYVYIVCRVASQGWSRMILYLWSFYSRSYFANYSLPPSVNIHRSDRVASLITDYRLQGPYSIPWGLRSVTQTTDTQRPPVSPGVWPVFPELSVIRNTKIFVSRCLEATGAQSRPYRPHNATIHPAIYSPQSMTSSNFLWYSCLIIKSHSIEPGAAQLGWQTARAQAAILVFIAVPAIYVSTLCCQAALNRALACDLTQHVSRLTPGPANSGHLEIYLGQTDTSGTWMDWRQKNWTRIKC